MCGIIPVRHCPASSDSSSTQARGTDTCDSPTTTKPASQLHWCGYNSGAATVMVPRSLARSTFAAAVRSSAAACGSSAVGRSAVWGLVGGAAKEGICLGLSGAESGRAGHAGHGELLTSDVGSQQPRRTQRFEPFDPNAYLVDCRSFDRTDRIDTDAGPHGTVGGQPLASIFREPGCRAGAGGLGWAGNVG